MNNPTSGGTMRTAGVVSAALHSAARGSGDGARGFFTLDGTVCTTDAVTNTPAPAAFNFDALWEAPVINSIFKVDLANRRLLANDVNGPTAFTGSFPAPITTRSSWCFIANRENQPPMSNLPVSEIMLRLLASCSVGRRLLVAVLAALLAACGSSDDSPAPPAPPAAVAPTITAGPAAATVTEGDSASFSVTAAGTAPLTYQWQRNGTAITGATAATYTLVTGLGDDSAQFRVVVSNSAGSTTSAAALLRVNARARPPTLTAQPASMTIAELNSVTLSVTVDGTPPFTYQWQRSPDGATYADIAGATGDSYTTPLLSRGDSGVRYRVIVNNATGQAITSTAAQITVNADAAVLAAAGGTVSGDNDAIRITVPAGALLGPTRFRFTALPTFPGPLPSDYTPIAGASYEIVTEGAGFVPNQPVTVRLAGAVPPAPAIAARAGETALDDRRARRLAQTPANRLVQQCGQGSIVADYPSDSDGGFRVVLCAPPAPGGIGNTSVGGITPQPAVLPTITRQPVDATASVGRSASFAVFATGPNLSYQWLRNGTPISGATNASYVIDSVTRSDFGAVFRVRVSNRFGEETSATATLSEDTRPPQVGAWTARSPLSAYATFLGAPEQVFGEYVVNNDGTLETSLAGGPLATGVVGDPIVVGDNSAQTGLVAVLFRERISGSSCPGGDRLRAVPVYREIESARTYRGTAITLLDAGCLNDRGVAATIARNKVSFEFAAVAGNSGTNLVVGSVAISGFGDSPPNPRLTVVGTPAPLSLDALCTSPFFSSRAMAGSAGAYSYFPPVSDTRTQAVLAFTTVRGSGGLNSSAVCVATMAPGGTWSAARPVWSDGDVFTAVPQAMAAMRGDGTALVAASRLLSGNHQIAVASRGGDAAPNAPNGGWVIETPQQSTSLTRPELAFDASGNATLVYRAQTGSPAFDVIFAATRSANGAWGNRTAVSPAARNTLFPRVLVAANGDTVVQYQVAIDGSSAYNLMETSLIAGQWQLPTPLAPEDGAINRTDASMSQRTQSVGGAVADSVVAYWRETEPGGSRLRIAGAFKQR